MGQAQKLAFEFGLCLGRGKTLYGNAFKDFMYLVDKDATPIAVFRVKYTSQEVMDRIWEYADTITQPYT